MTGGLTAPKDQTVIDVDDLISSGGVEPGDNSSVLPANTPKKLIFDFEDDDGTVVEVVEEVFPKDPVAAEIATTTKLTNEYTITTNKNITTKKPQKIK